MRVALGAGRGALVRQWMTECLLLALIGGLAGLLAARWITDVLLQFVPEINRDALRFHASPEVLLFATGLSVAAACLFGWLPTLRASRVNPNDVLRAIGPSNTARRGRVAEMVLAAQLAASLVLVVGALLFAQTLWNLNHQDAGYERQTVVYASPEFFRARYPHEQLPETMRQIMERVRNSPLFVRVAVGPRPERRRRRVGLGARARLCLRDRRGQRRLQPLRFAGLLRHRVHSAAGRARLRGARTQRRIRRRSSCRTSWRATTSGTREPRSASGFPWGRGRRSEVVGVVADIIDGPLRSGVKEILYWPMSGNAPGAIVARLAPGVDVRAAQAELRASIAAFAKAKAVPVETGRLEDHVQETLKDDRLVGELSVALGLLGVFLASIGLFGAVAHWAAGRTREIAIRLTLGATPGHIARLVLRRGLAIIGLGVVAGVPIATASAALIQPTALRSHTTRRADTRDGGRDSGRGGAARRVLAGVARGPRQCAGRVALGVTRPREARPRRAKRAPAARSPPPRERSGARPEVQLPLLCPTGKPR